MKFFITHDKEKLIDFIHSYLPTVAVGKKADTVINGDKLNGIIENMELKAKTEDGEDVHRLVVTITNEEKGTKDIRSIPLLEETKVEAGRELITFETQKHTTVIELG